MERQLQNFSQRDNANDKNDCKGHFQGRPGLCCSLCEVEDEDDDEDEEDAMPNAHTGPTRGQKLLG